MKWVLRRLVCGMLAALFFWFGTVISDRKLLSESLVGVCVTATSDGESDWEIARDVAAAVQTFLSTGNGLAVDPDALAMIAAGAASDGVTMDCCVSLDWEYLGGNEGTGVPMPAGYYRTVRITLGNGNGDNCWCLVTAGGVDAWLGERAACTRNVPGRVAFGLRFLMVDFLGRLEKLRGIG